MSDRISLIPPSVMALGFLLAAAWGFVGYCALRWLVSACGRYKVNGRILFLASGGVWSLVLGSRLCLARGRVSWAPYLDQWYSEIRDLMAPLAHGTLALGDLFAGNNEHRIVLTRMLSLLMVAVNGEWDNRVTVLAMFVLQSASVAWLCAVAWCFLGWARGSLVALAATLPMVLLCDWENIVSGFQSQFGFMVLGSVVAFALLEIPPSRDSEGWGAMAACLLMLGSMASGLLSALALGLTGLLGLLVARRKWERGDMFYLIALGIALIGWTTRSRYDAGPTLRAQGVGDFTRAFLAYGSWPLSPTALGLALLWIPWAFLLFRILARRARSQRDSFAVVLGSWVLLQAAALAWSRAGLSSVVSSRYTEILSVAFVANLMAALLSIEATPAGNKRRTLGFAAAAWILLVGGAQVYRSQTVYRAYVAPFRELTLEHEARLSTFARTGDPRIITDSALPHVPCPPEILLPLMQDGAVRALLPAPLRREMASGGGPAPEGGPLSYLAVRALRNGAYFVAIGIAGMILAGLFIHGEGRTRRASRPRV